MKKLSTVQRHLDKIYSINYGGCGVSALAMYRWLKKNKMLVGDEYFVFLYVSYDSNYDVNDKILKRKRSRKKIDSGSHIMLHHNGQLFDSMGSEIQRRYVKRHDNITEKQLLDALNYGGWNDSFDREEYIPKIMRMLKIDLNDVEIYI